MRELMSDARWRQLLGKARARLAVGGDDFPAYLLRQATHRGGAGPVPGRATRHRADEGRAWVVVRLAGHPRAQAGQGPPPAAEAPRHHAAAARLGLFMKLIPAGLLEAGGGQVASGESFCGDQIWLNLIRYSDYVWRVLLW